MQTLELGSYYLDLVDIRDFQSYLEEHENSFSSVAYKNYLKAVDIPPKFFKEQPIETQKELLDNRSIFVRETKKYFDKVIVVLRLKLDGTILNACRMVGKEALSNYEKLKTIDEVPNKFEHRSFIKDGYISYIISKDNDIKKDTDNKVIAVDFPILLNKKPVIHNALYTLPNDTFATPVEHIQYLTSDEVDLETTYADIKAAIFSVLSFFNDDIETKDAQDILREPEVVALALVESGYIPKSYAEKVGIYIKENVKGVLNTKNLESLVLDYDETFRSYKQVTSLRSINGHAVLDFLNSDEFKSAMENLETIQEELAALEL